MELCPKCKSIFIQFDNITEKCYCLIRECRYEWYQNLIRKNIENIYLRTSMFKEKSNA